MIADVITLAATGIIALASARFSREPKYHRCIDGYAMCVSAKVEENRCQKILHLCDKPKKEEEPRNRGEI